MASILNIALTKTGPVTLTRDEGWYCSTGSVRATDGDPGTDLEAGVLLDAGMSWPFPAGAQVYYWALPGPAARIEREPIA